MSSSRRTGGEIHILAMLDGKTPGALSRRLLGLPRAFWYTVAAVCICVLIAALAWLARTPASTPVADSDEATLQPTPPAPTPKPTEPDAIASTPGSTPGATIIDGAGATTPLAPTMPSTLPPASIPAFSASNPSQPSHDVAPLPSRSPEESAAPAPTHAAASKHAPAHAAVRTTTGERKSATPHASANRADAPPRTKRQASAAKPTSAATVDTDVALISAIIQHTNAHPDPADAEPDTPPNCIKPGCHKRLPNRQ